MWCHAEFEKTDGPTHEYLESTPSCWAAFGEVLAREYENGPLFAAAHRYTVDAYAVQHPGKPERRQIQSVWVHLVALYALFEENCPPRVAKKRMERLANKKDELEWLDPPDFSNTPNVISVLNTTTDEEHVAVAKAWAQSLWEAWYTKHKDAINQKIQKR